MLFSLLPSMCGLVVAHEIVYFLTYTYYRKSYMMGRKIDVYIYIHFVVPCVQKSVFWKICAFGLLSAGLMQRSTNQTIGMIVINFDMWGYFCHILGHFKNFSLNSKFGNINKIQTYGFLKIDANDFAQVQSLRHQQNVFVTNSPKMLASHGTVIKQLISQNRLTVFLQILRIMTPPPPPVINKILCKVSN